MIARHALLIAGLFWAKSAVPAEVPYAKLHGALDAVQSARAYDQLRAVQRIESKLPDVPPSAIRLTVKAAAGDIPVPVLSDGRVEFPLTAELLAQNPIVLTNQPAGSLTLLVSIELPPPDDAHFTSEELIEALDQADRLFANTGEHDGRHVRGIEFRFPRGTGSVTLRGASERLLVPDAEGRVVLMRDSDLAAAAAVELSAQPLRVLPFLER